MQVVDRRDRDGPVGAADFIWQGHDEMERLCGSGWVELDDETLSGKISFPSGDEATLKAYRC